MTCLRVKICGITNPEDALAAAEAGADAIGLNFVGGPRQIEPTAAADILESLSPMVTPVALVRLEAGGVPDDLLELLGEFWVSHLQVYGNITSGSLAVLRRDGFRPLPVLPVRGPEFPDDAASWFSNGPSFGPAGIVLDTFDPSLEGGSGRPFRWEWVQEARRSGALADWPSIILAGGLTPDNVAEAVRTIEPFAVDVSSGVEMTDRPGRKDKVKMRNLIQCAKAALG